MTDTTSNNGEPVAQRNSRATLERLLNEMIEHPEQREAIGQTIKDVFEQNKAVMILDMSGFSRMTHKHGIALFLLMIHQMQLIARPCVEAAHGLLLKAEADNLFCLFDTVDDAVYASREIVERLGAANLLLPEDQNLYVSIGIGYGPILNIADQDLFGDQVNLASKLGEEIAAKEQILLTPEARAHLIDANIELREEKISVSGLALSYYRIQV